MKLESLVKLPSDKFLKELLNLPPDKLVNFLHLLPDDLRKEFFAVLKELDRRKFYQLNPLNWLEDILHINPITIKWSLHPEYENQGYVVDGKYTDKWDGTPDPLFTAIDNIANWKDTALESATGTGKSYLTAALIYWFLDCWPEDTHVLTFAPRQEQLDNIWKHVKDLFPFFKERWPDAVYMESRQIKRKKNGGYKSGSWIAEGKIAEVGSGETVAGKARGTHAENMLIIFDEANAIDEAIVNAQELTSVAPHNLKLYSGNPDNVNDTLHKRFIMQNIQNIRISAYDHPNVVTDDPGIVPGATSKKFISYMRDKCSLGGEDYKEHSEYISRVRGICPTTSAHSLIPNICLNKTQKWFEDEYQRYINHPNFQTKKHYSPTDPILEGETFIYRLPENWANRYVISCDVAGSNASGDAHASVVFDRVKKCPVATIRMRGKPDDFVREIIRVAEKFVVRNSETGNRYYPFLVWETNGVGQLIGYEEIQRYPRNFVYHRQNVSQHNAKVKDFPGWYTGSKERAVIQDRIQEWGIRLIEYPERVVDKVLFEELKTLVYNDKKDRYEAMEGFHDDLAFTALGIALAVDNQLISGGNVPFELKSSPFVTARRGHVETSTGKGGGMFNNIKLPVSL